MCKYIDAALRKYTDICANLFYIYMFISNMQEKSKSLFVRILTEHAHNKTIIAIDPSTPLGKYFFLDHGTRVVIGKDSNINDNVFLLESVILNSIVHALMIVR